MGVNKVNGNMYGFCDGTWNVIRGICQFDCNYCSIKGIAKRFNQKQKPAHLVEKELSTDLGEGNLIFVGCYDSETEALTKDGWKSWIQKVLAHCSKFDNTYLFQSKDPARFVGLINDFPKKVILGTTLESNRNHPVSCAPKPENRKDALFDLMRMGFQTMVSIEPILDFDLDIFVKWLKDLNPAFIAIGADSKGHNLDEPSPEKVAALIKELKKVTEVRIKPNLKRIYNG